MYLLNFRDEEERVPFMFGLLVMEESIMTPVLLMDMSIVSTQ